MFASLRRKPPVDGRILHSLTISAAACVGMSVFKMMVCGLAPKVLNDKTGPEVDQAIFLAGSFFMISGFIAIYSLRIVRPALVLFMVSFYFLFVVGSVTGQLTVFHLGRDFGLVDAQVAGWDACLGFDWVSYFEWVASRPALSWILAQAYHSIWFQPFLLMALFIWRRNVRGFATLQIALPASLILVCFVATFLPALGAYQFHGMTPDRHPGMALAFTDEMTAPILWLRQANLPSVMPSFPDLRIVQFPSWHAATAVIFMLSAWGLPIVRWIGLALNVLMLAATPIQGSHYLSDVMIGCAVGGLSFALAAWALSGQPRVGISTCARLTAFAKPRTDGTFTLKQTRP